MHSPVLGCSPQLEGCRMLLGIHVQTCARYSFYVQNGNYKGQSLFQLFSAAWIQTPEDWQLQAASGCQWHQFVPTCLGAAWENAWNQWIFGSVPACRFTANVQHDVHSCCGVHLVSSLHPCWVECLISQLMKLLPLGLYNMATLHVLCCVAERGVHI